MAILVSIDRDLVIRIGNSTYQFIRYLDDRKRVQLENQLTGEFKIFETARFCEKLQSMEFVIVQGGKEINKEKNWVLDLSQLPARYKKQVEIKIGLVKRLKKNGIRRGQKKRIAECAEKYFEELGEDVLNGWNKRPSTSAIVNWYRDFEVSGCNAASMVTGNLHKQRRREISPRVEEAMEWALKNFYLNRGRLSLTYTHERLRSRLKGMEENGEISSQEAKVSLATLQRRKEELDPYTVNAKRYGIPYANQKFRYTIQGTDVPRAMARLEVDHTKLNWVVVCDRTGLPLGRPTLTVVVCSYSGYIVGLYLSFNNAGLTSVVNVLKNSIRPKGDLAEAAGTKNSWISWGVGDTYLLDNGMEFHSKNFQSIAWELGCDIEYCRVRFPWMKPRVERFMLDLDYLTLTSGRIFKPDPNILSIDPKKDAITTLDQLCKGLILFVVDQHAFTPNRRTLECPYDRYAESVERSPPPQIPLTLNGLDLIAAMSKEMTITNGGLEFYGLTYAGYELKEMLRAAGGKFKTLVKWNPDDLSYMYVQHARTKEWVTLGCTRSDYANGLTWNQHRLVRKVARNDLRRDRKIEDLLDAKQRLHELWMNPLLQKNKKLELESAKRFSRLGATTVQISDKFGSPVHPSSILAAEELTYTSADVPEFESILF